MEGASESTGDTARRLAEFAPLLRRIESLDADTLVRLRLDGDAAGPTAIPTATLFAALPFGVLVSRTIPLASAAAADDAESSRVPETELGAESAVNSQINLTGSVQAASAGSSQSVESSALPIGVSSAGPMLAWLLGQAPAPAPRDDEWRGTLPPMRGWRRLDVLDDAVIRDRVRAGAIALQDLSRDAGVDEQIRQPAIDALLDSVVLTVIGEPSDEGPRGPISARVTLRTLSVTIRMGFVPRGSSVAVDTCRGWHRVAAQFGCAYATMVAPGVRRALPGLLPVLN